MPKLKDLSLNYCPNILLNLPNLEKIDLNSSTIDLNSNLPSLKNFKYIFQKDYSRLDEEENIKIFANFAETIDLNIL